ncbi:hypothetical protein KW420_09065 [Vibrio fluvialis]|nr:hypothetical protein [Vibrio fluvialis]MBY7952226.1 hypothetical protein [Vibrio fluvialis]
MSELKNKFGDNVSWLLLDVASQIDCELEKSDTIETGFEIYCETEDGRETRCEVDLVDLLESASVAINDAESERTTITKQRDELEQFVKSIANAEVKAVEVSGRYGGTDELTFICDSHRERAIDLLSTINEQKGSN